jgi:hypothetical protein
VISTWAVAFLVLAPHSVWAVRCANGIYVTAGWATESPSGDDARTMAAHLKEAGIENVFVLAKGIQESHSRQLDTFFRIVRSQVPSAKFIAMIGRRVCTESSSKRCVRISDRGVQRDILSTALLYWRLGFDGVQLDLEPVASGDESLINLLVMLRNRRSTGQFVSLAGYSLRLDGGAERKLTPSPKGTNRLLTWDREYYRRLFALTDQVMVMNYDTALRTTADFQEFTTWQVRELSALAPSAVDLQIGLPSDVHGRTGLFDRKAENLVAGLAAVGRALNGRRCPKNFGITIFTVDGMTQAMWQELKAGFASE